MKKAWIQPEVETLIIEDTASASAYCWGNTDEFSGPEDEGGLPGNNRPGNNHDNNRPGNNRPGEFWGGGPGFGKR